jgi:proteasome accessory factor C
VTVGQPPRMVTSAERLRRLLALVPYVVSRKSVGLAETAAAFGMTERELVDDLNLVWCVELKAPDPYCPIDLSYEGGEIVVSQAESIARPLRLAADEASALLVALRMLAEMPGDRSALSRLIAKLEAAAGAAAAASAQVAVQIDTPNGMGLAPQIRAALSDGKRLHLRYYVPGRDEATERDVDPMRLLVVEGRTYLEGWCRLAEGVRLFRLDRVLDLAVLDVPAEVPASAEPVDVDRGLFRPSESDERVELELSAAARWVAEYYPCESVTELGEGRLRVVLRTPDTRWVRRLALRLGEDGRVVAPATLASGIRAEAAAALALYDLRVMFFLVLRNSRGAAVAVEDVTADGPAPRARGWRAGLRAAGLRLIWVGVLAVVAVVLFWCYLRQSQTAGTNADGSGVALQGWEMLHGNLLLSGWWLSDVSFYTFEVPMDAVVEAIHGLNADAVHITAAVLYVALVLSAALLARGRARGREGVVRAVLAAGIMVAPGFNPATRILLGSPDHTGVGVPILLTFLLVDLARQRWWVPAAMCVLLVWAQVDDPTASFAAAAPIALVCLVRAGMPRVFRRGVGWYDATLGAAAIVSYGLAQLVVLAVKAAGGYSMASLSQASQIAPFSTLGTQLQHTGQNLLFLFGAGYLEPPGVMTAIGAVHFIGVLLALCGVLAGIVALFQRGDRVTQVITIGTLVTLAAGSATTTDTVVSGAHEIAVVLPFGAVLAGRTIGPWLTERRLPRVVLAPVLGVVLVCYLAGLGYNVSQPPRPADTQSLADWLLAHHLARGLGKYWAANSTTLASGGRVRVAPAVANGRGARTWVTKPSWYDPATSYANFVVATSGGQTPSAFNVNGVLQAFGKPAREYHADGYVILVWNKNLLSQVATPVQPHPYLG